MQLRMLITLLLTLFETFAPSISLSYLPLRMQWSGHTMQVVLEEEQSLSVGSFTRG